jgi:molybdopterin-guanine dinucleotide biosynthesis protein A
MSCCVGLLRADRRIVLGAIIAGGRSTRFGSDKAVATIGGRALIDHVTDALAGQCNELVVVGRDHDGLRTISDQPAPGMGPLGGIAAALLEARAAGYVCVLTAPCDAYDLPGSLTETLYPFPGYAESLPIVGLWPVSAAETALEMLADPTSNHSIRGFADRIGARAVQLPRAPANINTAADLERVERYGL